jgi:UDP-N-acetylmuramoyl-tripeptide--D-alanyl-D-alanine ligase
MIKKIARSIVVAILGFQTKRLIKKHKPTIVAVVGSIGKTSTKRAIAEVLDKTLKVQYQSGNYNDLATVPLVLFGQTMPALFNPFAWIKVFLRNEIQLAKPYPYDVAVVELGTDGPGQIKAFSRYLHVDIAVVAALTPEHMEFFENLDAVIAEELSVTTFANKIIINADLAPIKSIQALSDPITYAINGDANFRATDISYGVENSSVQILKDKEPFVTATLPLFSEAQMYSALAASAVWDTMQLPTNELPTALEAISPVPGRMQLLQGIKGATIIDDSYNASPEAMKSALDTLYRLPVPHKIALLGNMNELGEFGIEAHREIGAYCDPDRLDEVVTLGPEANAYLAPAAQAKGCKVTTFDSPYAAGEYLKSALPENAIVLIKGSQNKVFAEESVKLLLANPADETKLVRQSKDWLAVKKKQFHV